MDVCKRITVPISFNKASIHSLGEAMFLAQKNGAEIVMVHVNTDPAKTERYFDTKFRKVIEDQGEIGHNLHISWRVIPGQPNTIVRQVAKTINQLEPLFSVIGYDVKSKFDLGPNIKEMVYKTNYPVSARKRGGTVRE